MILQALYDYYERKKDDLAPSGFQRQDIHFLILLSRDGQFIDLQNVQERRGNRWIGRSFLVPQGPVRSGPNAWETAYLLWDNLAYVLGWNEEKPEDARRKHQAFKNKIGSTFSADEPEEIHAVKAFLKREDFSCIFQHPRWKDVLEKGNPNITFKIQGQTGIVSDLLLGGGLTASVSESPNEKRVGKSSICLVTGAKEPIALVHEPYLKHRKFEKSGGTLVNFKQESFRSYGKEKSANAPVSVSATFKYLTALRHLLSEQSGQCIDIGDSAAMFWAERSVPLEGLLCEIFGEDFNKDDPGRNTRAVEALFDAPRSGQLALDDDQTKFFVLGLAPSSKRLSVRFWHVSTVAELADRIRRHFEDLRIVLPSHAMEYLSIFRLLVATAVQGKADNIPPNLGGDMMRSILEGLSYPRTLLSGALRRIRAEHDITPVRAAIIKACLVRQNRFASNPSEKEVTVSLDETNDNPAYRLGRLFAVLEKSQEEAFWPQQLNKTIRDSSYGAASSTPVTVFPRLLKLNNHHLGKLENRGRAVNLGKMIGQIVDAIDGRKGFPAHLDLDDQGRFAIGYYHQRQAFFTKQEKTE